MTKPGAIAFGRFDGFLKTHAIYPEGERFLNFFNK
jgi:hypothetical protein